MFERTHSLGIKLQQNGKWTGHIRRHDQQSKQKHADIIRCLTNKLSSKSTVTLYVTYVRLILEYGAVKWDSWNDYEKDKLEKVQQMWMGPKTGARRGTGHDNYTSTLI